MQSATIQQVSKKSITRSDILNWSLAIASLSVLLAILPHALAVRFFKFCIAGSLVLLYAAFCRAEQRKYLLSIAAWLPVYVLATSPILNVVTFLTPRTIDSSLDFGVGRACYVWAMQHQYCWFFFALVYVAIGFVAAAAIGASLNPRRAVRSLIVATIIVLPLYVAFPATGPAFIHDRIAPRYCMPSLHLTWAILIAWYSHRSLRPTFIVYAVLIAISTLALGEHYVADLIAAIPTAAFCIWENV